MKQIRKRVTYANVMSSIAVFLILGGATAYAAKKVGSNEIKGNSINTGKLKKEAVTTSKLKKNAVTTAKIANNAVTSEKVKDGSLTGTDINLTTLGTVPTAASAQPTAFAQVSASGAINAANSKNVGSVTKVGTSIYCISGVSFAPRGGQATVDFNDSGFEYAQFGLGNDNGACPAGTQAFVFTVASSTNTATAAGFFVVFYG